MRIGDWSADVLLFRSRHRRRALPCLSKPRRMPSAGLRSSAAPPGPDLLLLCVGHPLADRLEPVENALTQLRSGRPARKRVVAGERVAVRVASGGRRIFKNKNHNNNRANEESKSN